MRRPHPRGRIRRRTYTDDLSRRGPPDCRRCGESSVSLDRGNPAFAEGGVCWDCRQDVAAGGPAGDDAESLIDRADD